MKNEEIAKIVLRVKSGEKMAFQEIYNETVQIVYHYVYRMINRKEDAEDVTQEIYCDVFHQIKRLRHPEAFNQWLSRIMVSACSKYLRKNGGKELTHQEVNEMIVEEKMDFIPEKVLEQSELCNEILEIVNNLPYKQREATLLYYYQDLSVKDISQITKSSEVAVMNRLHEARKKMRQKLENERVVFTSDKYMGFVPFIGIILQNDAIKITPPIVKTAIWNKVAIDTGLVTAAGVSTISLTNIGIVVGIVATIGLGTTFGVNMLNEKNKEIPIQTISVENNANLEDLVKEFLTVASATDYDRFCTKYKIQEFSAAIINGNVQYKMGILPKIDGKNFYAGIKISEGNLLKAYELNENTLHFNMPTETINWFEKNKAE